MESLKLPTTGDIDSWSPDEKALLAFAGLTYKVDDPNNPNQKVTLWAPRPFVVGFLSHCERTGLDPIAKQIYAINRKGEWSIQVSIDGMRVVAQRSREYEGQTMPMWCGLDGVWRDVWLSDEHPSAARVGVWRKGFREPTYGVARFRSYAPTREVWAAPAGGGARRPTGEVELMGLWKTGDDFMIEKVAEAKALRKAFPMDLSGLYIPEELASGDMLVVQENEPQRVPASQRSRVAKAVLAADSAAEGVEGVTTPESDSVASDGRTGPDSGGDVALVECARCGDMVPAVDSDGLCDSCAAEVDAELREALIAAGEEPRKKPAPRRAGGAS